MRPRRRCSWLVSAVVLLHVALLLLLVTGCATPAGQGSRLLPWNWFHPDANARLAKAENSQVEAAGQTIQAAHVETFKAGLALATAGDSVQVQTARRMLGNANGLLAQVAPLTAAEDAAARAIVTGLLSGSAEFMAKAEKAQASQEKGNARKAADLVEATASLKAAEGKIAAANMENATTAAKYRRVWFWIYLVGGAWLALQALSGLARFYPGLAPIARLAGTLVAPAVQAAYARTTSAVSKAIADAEEAGGTAADTVRGFLDARMDSPEQAVIAAPFKKFP